MKAGRRPVRAPVYSHIIYDIMPNEWVEVDRPDILIVEGLNVLQTGRLPRDGKAIPFVSDFFDFSIYLDADEACCAMVRRALPGAARRPRSAIRYRISIAMRRCPTRKPPATALPIWSTSCRISRINIWSTRPAPADSEVGRRRRLRDARASL